MNSTPRTFATDTAFRPDQEAILGDMVAKLLTEDTGQQNLDPNSDVAAVSIVSESKLIAFPDDNHFAEGFVVVDDNTLWFPLNTGRTHASGLYEYKIDTDTFTLLQAWPDQRMTVFGGIITGINRDTFVGCIINNANLVNTVPVPNAGAIIVIKPGNPQGLKEILVPGGPNDVCVDATDLNYVYVATNEDNTNTTPCGAVYRVNITGQVSAKKVLGGLLIASGIHMVKTGDNKGTLYIGTLPEVVKTEVTNGVFGSVTKVIDGSGEKCFPLFDNVRPISKGLNDSAPKLLVSVYAYYQRRTYNWLNDEILRNFVWKIQSQTMPLGVSVGAYENLYRDQNQSRIVFYTIDTRSGGDFVKSYVFNEVIKGKIYPEGPEVTFDAEVTNIDCISNGNKLILANYKANYFAVVTCSLP